MEGKIGSCPIPILKARWNVGNRQQFKRRIQFAGRYIWSWWKTWKRIRATLVASTMICLALFVKLSAVGDHGLPLCVEVQVGILLQQ